nr:hypothetical protein [Tanacetum cinerariifolium]
MSTNQHGEVLLLTESGDMVVAPSNKTVRLVSHTIVEEIKDHAGKKKLKVGLSADELPMKKIRSCDVVISEPNPTTAGKSPAALRMLELQSGQLDVGTGSVPHPTDSLFLLLLLQLWSLWFMRILAHLMMGAFGHVVCPNVMSFLPLVMSMGMLIMFFSNTTSPKLGSLNPRVQMKVKDVDVGLRNETVNTYLPENDAGMNTFGRNIRDLGSFGEETDKTMDLHQNLLKIMLTERRDGVTSIKRRRHDLRSDDVSTLVTLSEHG